jgi:type IV secretion system protein VirB6
MSTACDAMLQEATAGVEASLRAVDCASAEATSTAFSRLFGMHGALLPALSVMLTLYVAIFALLLLTGRSRLGIGALTPRMITLGLVLTFTTSSVAYQAVVWNLAVGAPDQIASVLMGSQGSATHIFAERIDILFNAIGEAASAGAPQAGAARASPGSFTPSNLMWISALMLMLGTVGVLVTARILLAILLGIGPVFITLVLFKGTRGLFAGWMRGVVLTAFTPLIAVLAGAAVVEFAVPVVAVLRSDEGIDGRAAMALFLIAAVYCAIMVMALRIAGTMVAGWRVFGMAGEERKEARSEGGRQIISAPPAPATAGSFTAPAPLRSMVSGLSAAALPAPAQPGAPVAAEGRSLRNIVIPATASGAAVRPTQPSRARGVGSRFSSRSTPAGRFVR